MENNLLREKKIEATLNSLDDIKPAIASPYFYTRVLARINLTTTTVWEKWSAFFLRHSIAFLSICFIIVINVLVLYSKYDNNYPVINQAEVSSSDEYSETVTTLYDLENVKP